MPHGTVIPHYRVTDIGIENPVVVATVIFAGWDSRRSYKGSNNSRWEFIVSILFVMGKKRIENAATSAPISPECTE